MKSIQIQLKNQKRIFYEMLFWEMILSVIAAAILIPFYFNFAGVSLLSILFIIIAAAAGFAVRFYFAVKEVNERLREISNTFSSEGLYAVQTVQAGVPVIQCSGATYLYENPKHIIPWTAKFSVLWRSKKYVCLTCRAKTGEHCNLSLPRRSLIENYDEVIAFLKLLPNVPPVIFQALE